MSPEIQTLKDVIETWNIRKTEIIQEFSASDARNFAEHMNFYSKRLITAFDGIRDPDFWMGLAELANNASTIAARARLIIDGVDRSKD